MDGVDRFSKGFDNNMTEIIFKNPSGD
jgi:hypothetical protein